MLPQPPQFVPSPEQQQVISHRDGHLQVIACAGAGKTEAISRRVASLITEGVEPSAIVAFTFTERAAVSLKTRITKRVAEAKGQVFLDRLGPMFVGTIHAYCLRLLQDHVTELANFDILDAHRLAGLLSREFKRLKLNKIGPKHWRPIADFLRNANVVENESIDRTLLKGSSFGDCYNAFCETLYRYRFLTYGLLITAALKALDNEDIFKRVHGSLQHLIVDEYQDINPAQEKLIAKLSQSPVQLCVVADDDQSIYQWRGSDVSNMLEFTQRYPDATPVTLSVNRRSRPEIIQTANTFADSICPRLPKQMGTFRPGSEPEVVCWAAETARAEAEVIADTIEKLQDRGYRYKDIAVLYRSVRTSSPPLIEVFETRGIPFRCAGRTGLFLQPEALVLGKTYAWLINYEWKSARYGESEVVELDDLVAEYEAVFTDGEPIEELELYLNHWKHLVKDNSAPINLVRDFYRLLNLLGVQHLNLDDPSDSARMGCLARFSQILADFEHVTRRGRYLEENGKREYRGGTDRGQYFYQRLYNFLQYYALDAYEDFEGEENFDLDTVDILTIHQAKGLEWPVVFVPSLVQGRFPSQYAGRSQDWLIPEEHFPPEAQQRYQGSETEERRLFYVAITRAKDILYLSRFRKLKNKFKPSVFLEEVAGSDPPIVCELPLPEPFTPPPDDAEDLPTISFSELALFESCPMRYRMSSSLGFQPQLVTELGYGKAIHHILRELAEFTQAKGSLPTAEEIKKLFRQAFYLPFANQAAAENLAARAWSLVHKYLKDHHSDLLRIWATERAFELHLEKGIVNGRADVILDRENGIVDNLAIVDYKTSNETKPDDLYAFQLAIYAGAGRGEGLNVEAGYVHMLKENERRGFPIDVVAVKVARGRADVLIDGIREGLFPARPDQEKCKRCDVKAICGHAKIGKYDL